MASTYTSNLRLTKQGDGDNPNTWGQVLNDGVISLVDDAVAGYTTVSIGSTVSVTLTNNQGSGDQSRSAILELTGSIGGTHTSIFVLIPNNSKSYVIRNSVSNNNSSDAVILRVAGNTGVTIPPSSNTFVITNGTSVYNVAPATFGSAITVQGAATFESTVTVSGAANFQSTVTVLGNGTFKGDVHVSSKVCASAFYGDGVNISGLLPPGVIVPYGVTAAPTGFLLCNGTAVSRSTYAALFAVVSSLYGDGNGSSTFNVPDLRGRFLAGWDAGAGDNALTSTAGAPGSMIVGASIANTGGIQAVTLSVAEMPTHDHTYTRYSSKEGGNEGSGGVWMNDSTVSTGEKGGNGAHSNIPPAMILNFIIKT
jgi:microcystin-dependent protein